MRGRWPGEVCGCALRPGGPVVASVISLSVPSRGNRDYQWRRGPEPPSVLPSAARLQGGLAMNLTPALAVPLLLLGSATPQAPANTAVAPPPAVVYAPTVFAAPTVNVTGPGYAPGYATGGSYRWFSDAGSHTWHRRFVHNDYHYSY